MAQKISLSSRARVRRDVLSRDLEGEAVLLDLRSGVYFGLDPVGTRIWHLIEERRSLRQIRDALLDEYDVAEVRCQQDLLRFVARLRKEAFVELME